MSAVQYLLNTRTKTVLVATEALLAHGGKHLIPYDPDNGPIVVDPAIAGYVARIKDLEAHVAGFLGTVEGLEAEISALKGGVSVAEKGESEKLAALAPAGGPAAPADFNRITLIADAIRTLTPDQFTTTGLPRADALEALVGKTTSEERQQAMELNKQLKE